METIQRQITKKDQIIRNENFVIAIVGAIGKGKTSLINDILTECKEEVREDGNGSYYIKFAVKSIGFDPFNQLDHLVDSTIQARKDLTKCNIKDSLVVLDELNDFAQDQKEMESVASLLVSRKHYNNNFIYSCRSISDIPNKIMLLTTHFYVFHTNPSVRKTINRDIPLNNLFNDAQDRIFRYAKKHGLGKHRLDPSFDGQGFPYCIIDAEKLTISEINMEKEY